MIRSIVCALALAMAANAHAQAGSEGPKEQQQAPAPTPPGPAPQQTASPAPNEGFRWGLMEGRSEVEIGYRWVSQAGNRDVYRSMVNLGEGPRLLRSSLSLVSSYGAGALFDRLDLDIHNWGGDPYNTMRLRVGRSDLYELRLDYRNLNYYNFLPSYSNPLLQSGSLLGQHSLNVTSRTTSAELRLFPHRRFRPFVGYSRTSGFGGGTTTISSTGNEFLVASDWRYAADEYRGGAELQLGRLTLTLEQGYRVLRNDSGAGRDDASSGNNSRLYLGKKITLDSADRAYRDRTTMPISRVLATWEPRSNLALTARYVRSSASVESEFSQLNTGSFVSLEELLFYRTGADRFDARAESPSQAGGFVLRYAPFSRMTLTNELDARSYEISGSALLGSVLYGLTPVSGIAPSSGERRIDRESDSLVGYDHVRNQAEMEVEVGKGFALRGGHRYSRMEVTLEDRSSREAEASSAASVQQAALAGFWFRRGRWLQLGLDYERSRSDRFLTRTDLFYYDQLRMNWRLRWGSKLSTSGHVALMQNNNSDSEIGLDSHNRSYAFTLGYEPSERFSLNLDYSRANLYSNLAILLPQTLDTDQSLFLERSHGVGGSVGFDIVRKIRAELGYRGVLNGGTAPLDYHQPFASIAVPLRNGLVWKTYWQYYGYNERSAGLQDHRSHLVTFALAYVR